MARHSRVTRADKRRERDIVVTGLDKLFKALKALPKDASVAMRKGAREIANRELPRLVAAGMASDKQSALVAKAIVAKNDRVPTIIAGGSKLLPVERKVYRSRKLKTKRGRGRLIKPKAGDVFFGAEFGGGGRKTTHQFRKHLGHDGYWFWPQLHDDANEMITTYQRLIDEVLSADWGDNG